MARQTTSAMGLIAIAAVVIAAEIEVAPTDVWDVLPAEWLARPVERIILLVVVAALASCVLLAGWVDTRRRHPSTSGTAIGAALLAAAWAALPVALWVDHTWLRAIGLVVSALLPIALLHLIVAPGPRLASPAPRMSTRAVWTGAYALVAALAALYVLARDPFLDPRCLVHCEPLATPFTSTALVETVGLALRGVWVSAGVVAILYATRTFVRPPAGLHRARALAAAAAGSVEVAWAAAPSAAAVVGPHTFDHPALLIVRLASHGTLALMTGLVLVRQARRQGQLQRMAREIVALTPPHSVRDIIANRLGDPGARLDFHVPGEDLWIDEAGHPVPETAPIPENSSRQQATVSRDGQVVARVTFRAAEARAQDLEDALGPAAVLALDAERARSEGLLRLEMLRLARRRVVEASDLARRRAERDLHDGAQHLLLAATFAVQEGLQHARSLRDDANVASFDMALEQLTRLAADLRSVAHGMYPVLLNDAGLVPALEGLTLASGARTTVDAHLPGRVSPSAELTVYEACALTLAAAGDTPVAIDVSRRGDSLRLVLRGTELSDHPDLATVADRAVALGGTMVCMTGSMVLEVPCA